MPTGVALASPVFHIVSVARLIQAKALAEPVAPIHTHVPVNLKECKLWTEGPSLTYDSRPVSKGHPSLTFRVVIEANSSLAPCQKCKSVGM